MTADDQVVEEWPPPVTSGTAWTEIRVRVGRPSDREFARIQVREARLWGGVVQIDEAGHVFCRCCWGMVDVETLGTPGNGHHASPWPGALSVGGVAILPLRDDDAPTKASLPTEGF